jgi:hypothetical protein
MFGSFAGIFDGFFQGVAERFIQWVHEQFSASFFFPRPPMDFSISRSTKLPKVSSIALGEISRYLAVLETSSSPDSLLRYRL